MRARAPKSLITQRFENVGKYLDYVQGETDMPMRQRESRKAASSWSGGTDWDETVRLAIHGWPEGIQKVERFTNKLNVVLSGMIKVPEVMYGVEGMAVDIGTYQRGEPEFMMYVQDSAIRIDARPPKIVRIVINTCVSASNSPEVLIMRGASVAALALMLERHNVRAEIDLVSANRAGPGMETWVRIKNAEEMLNLPNLVFLLAHPSSFRKLMFSCWERQPAEVRYAFNIPGGYGYVGEVHDRKDRGDIYIGGSESWRGWSEDETLAWIIEELGKQGIEVRYD